MSIAGIDISSNNGGYKSVPTAGLDFCVVKLTQGTGYVNPMAVDQLAWARSWAKHVGVYHWVEPWVSATDQANHFIDTAHADGPFDFWYLDCEDPSHPTSASAWVACVNTILGLCKAHLGLENGGLYVGQFFEGGALVPLAKQNNWWLPDYGHNDGTAHAPSLGAQPVIHQYSSAGGLDRNVVLDEPAFARMVGASSPTPTPSPVPTSEVDVALVQAKGSTTVYTTTGIAIANQTDLNSWQAILVGVTGRKEAGNIWPVVQSFIDSITKGH